MHHRKSYRKARLAEVIRAQLSEILLKQPVLDTPVGFSILEVTVSADLRHAQIQISHAAPEHTVNAICQGLNQKEPRLRHSLSQHLELRRVPRLRFVPETQSRQI